MLAQVIGTLFVQCQRGDDTTRWLICIFFSVLITPEIIGSSVRVIARITSPPLLKGARSDGLQETQPYTRPVA